MTIESTRDSPRLAAPMQRQRAPELDVLSSLIGKWMTVGETISSDGTPAVPIHASDI